MPGWTVIVDVVRALVFAAAHLCGNSLGGGILAVSFAIRLAMLPLTVRVARRMMAHQARIVALAPELERLRHRHRGEPARLAEATQALYREHQIELMPRGTVGPMLLQIPVSAALYQAVTLGISGGRAGFLWIADLARPDAVVAGTAAVLAGVAAGAGSSPTNRTAMVVSTAVTFLLAWRLSASVGLYWLASNGVSAFQSALLRRTAVAARTG